MLPSSSEGKSDHELESTAADSVPRYVLSGIDPT